MRQTAQNQLTVMLNLINVWQRPFASAAEGVFMHQKVPCSFVLVCA